MEKDLGERARRRRDERGVRLVAGEEVASVDFLFDVFEVVGEAVGDDDGAGFFEAGKIAGDGTTVKLRFV